MEIKKELITPDLIDKWLGCDEQSGRILWDESNLYQAAFKQIEFFVYRMRLKEYEDYARKSGFSLNPNKKIVEGIVKLLLEREEKLGERFCPCRRVTGDTEEDKKIICPCIYQLF